MVLCLPLRFVAADPPKNFSEAKRLAKQIHFDHRKTFYCACRYDKHGKINLKSCGYQIQQNKRRAKRLEWEHIVPVSLWGRSLPCWTEALCCKAPKGKEEKAPCFKGRSCCREIDPHFAKMEADLHNLVPEIGELNALRSNYRFGVLPDIEKGQLGTCEFKIDPETRRVEPRDVVKGMVARAYLYMADQYGISLSKNQHQLYSAWNLQFPPDSWEILWDQRVALVQGNHNLYISEYSQKIGQGIK